MNDLSILIVDDDALLLDSIVRVLRRRFTVRTATSALRALEVLGARPREFFAVLSDFQMPHMDGPQFLAAAARIAPDARAILMSGALTTERLMRAINEAHVFRCLSKPVVPSDLLLAVEAAHRDFVEAMASEGSRTGT